MTFQVQPPELISLWASLPKTLERDLTGLAIEPGYVTGGITGEPSLRLTSSPGAVR